MKCVFKEIKEFSEPISISVLVDTVQVGEQIAELIKEHRLKIGRQALANIFGPFTANEISISQGISYFSTAKKETTDLVQILHSYLAQIAIEFATLTISCGNGSISSRSQNEWRNISFNAIERHYYGPSIKYERDTLHFINSKLDVKGSYELTFNLRFKCFDGLSYTSRKSLVIDFNNTEAYLRSVGMPYKTKFYLSPYDLPMKENPYKTETVIMFEKNISGKTDI